MSVPPATVAFTTEDLAIIDQMADHLPDALNARRHRSRPHGLPIGLEEFRTAVARIRDRTRAQLDTMMDERA